MLTSFVPLSTLFRTSLSLSPSSFLADTRCPRNNHVRTATASTSGEFPTRTVLEAVRPRKVRYIGISSTNSPSPLSLLRKESPRRPGR